MMDTSWVGDFFGAITAVAIAYNTYMTFRLKKLTIESKEVSEGNAASLVVVRAQGNENARAIEHTRVQNVELASAVEDTKVQNDNLAEQVGHVHVCVEAKAAELKDTVHEVVPAAIKEVIPAAIKEVVPDVIKETLPGAIATLKE